MNPSTQAMSFRDQVKHLLDQGIHAARQSQEELALSYFDQVLSLEPQHHEALFQLGLIAYKRKSFFLSVGYFQIAHVLNPQNVTVLSSLGSAYK